MSTSQAQDAVWEYVLDVPIVDFDGLQPYIAQEGDTTVIVNFWATWCVPCVKELPDFQKYYDQMSGPIKMVLVSLDFEGSTRKKLIPFINRNKVKPPVVHLVDYKMNEWIDKVSSQWSGALPATIVYRPDDTVSFHEGKFSDLQQLKQFINIKS